MYSASTRAREALTSELALWPRDEPVIELTDVSVAFGDKVVLDKLSLRILPRTTTVVIGRSGSGKTVLLKLMMGLLRPDRGSVRLFGHDLATASAIELVELRRHMGMLFQSYALFDALSVEANVEFPLHVGLHVPHRDAEKRSLELIEILGLAGSEDLLPAALSGGMRKRVGLARAIVGKPKIVLFDEPTTGLDPLMVEKVDEMIEVARRQYPLTSVIISHDLASVKRLADRVAFLHGGTITFDGTYDELVRSERPEIRDFLGVARTAVASASSDVLPAGPPVVELVGVHKSFGEKQVLRGVDLEIYPGQITVLIGGSGSGKSVIAKHVTGFLRPDRGRVVVFGTDLATLDERELEAIRMRIGLVFQHSGLLDWLSVEDNVAFPLVEHRRHEKREIRERVTDVLQRLDLGELAHRLPGELSPGERKRAALARAIVTHPEMLIYDEPTTGQDPLRAFEIDNLIQQTAQRFGVTSLVISHDMASTFRIANRVLMLHEGAIVACGSPADLLASRDEYVQRFLRAGHV